MSAFIEQRLNNTAPADKYKITRVFIVFFSFLLRSLNSMVHIIAPSREASFFRPPSQIRFSREGDAFFIS